MDLVGIGGWIEGAVDPSSVTWKVTQEVHARGGGDAGGGVGEGGEGGEGDGGGLGGSRGGGEGGGGGGGGLRHCVGPKFQSQPQVLSM